MADTLYTDLRKKLKEKGIDKTLRKMREIYNSPASLPECFIFDETGFDKNRSDSGFIGWWDEPAFETMVDTSLRYTDTYDDKKNMQRIGVVISTEGDMSAVIEGHELTDAEEIQAFHNFLSVQASFDEYIKIKNSKKDPVINDLIREVDSFLDDYSLSLPWQKDHSKDAALTADYDELYERFEKVLNNTERKS